MSSQCRWAALINTREVSELPEAVSSSSVPMQAYLRCVDMPSPVGLRALSAVSRDLLRRTAELPENEQGLLAVLAEYRYAVYAFIAAADAMCG
jgi:hypothetical protein